MFESARYRFGCSNVNAKVRKSEGALFRLHCLFDKVQSGVLTTDEAMIEVKTLFGEEGKAVPEFINELRRQFDNARRFPEQLSLSNEEWEECAEEPTEDAKKILRPPRQKPIPIPQHYRIEIWRESKKDQKRVKVTKL